MIFPGKWITRGLLKRTIHAHSLDTGGIHGGKQKNSVDGAKKQKKKRAEKKRKETEKQSQDLGKKTLAVINSLIASSAHRGHSVKPRHTSFLLFYWERKEGFSSFQINQIAFLFIVLCCRTTWRGKRSSCDPWCLELDGKHALFPLPPPPHSTPD